MKNIQKNTYKTVAIGLLMLLSLAFSGETVKAGFFDDLVDFLDPTQHIDDVIDTLDPTQHIEDIANGEIPGLPDLPGLPDGIGIPTLPNPEDLLNPPLMPVVETKGASDITSTSAKIEGYVNPHGAPSTVGFLEWGSVETLTNKGEEKAALVPSTIEETLTGLTPNTTYHYRVVGKNLLFEEKGDIKSFTTLTAGGNGGTTAPCATPHTMTLEEVKRAITDGGSGHGVIFREIDKNTGNGVIVNDTDCSFPVSMASYTLDNPNDEGYVDQTFFAASPANTISQPHSTLNLHVDLPRCNFQADYFYGDNYPRPKGSRNNPSPYFLDAGYIINREVAGGFSCSTTPPVLTLVCVPNPIGSLTIGQSIDYTAQVSGGTSGYTYSWTGTEDLTGNTATVSKTYSTIGDKTARVAVTSGDGQVKTADCNTNVVGGISPFDVICPAVDSTVRVDQPVTRQVEITGGTAPFEISWSGTDDLSGTGTSISKTYTSTGAKEASVKVTDATGRTLTRSCNTVVISGGGGGGGRRSTRSSNRPDVNLVEKVEPAPLANSIVYLSDVPYTGITDYPKVALFLLGVVFWSIVISAGMMIRNARKSRKNALIQNMTREEVSNFIDDAGAIKTLVEDEARNKMVLLSEDAIEALILQGEKNQQKTLSLLDAVIKANRISQGSDEWISINGEKVNAALFGNYGTSSVVNTLVS